MKDYTKLRLTSDASSNKLLKSGTGTFNVAVLPGVGERVGSVSIPHGFSSDNLLFQVATSDDIAGTNLNTVLPWRSSDGRVFIYARLDTTNLEIIRINSDTSGFGFAATTVRYSYRILIP